jgi:hypothetical protein
MKRQICKNIIAVFTFLFSMWTANATFGAGENDQSSKIVPFQEATIRIEPPGARSGISDKPEIGVPIGDALRELTGIEPPGGGPGTPNGQETGVPVGDAFLVLLGLGLIYGAYQFKKKRMEAGQTRI